MNEIIPSEPACIHVDNLEKLENDKNANDFGSWHNIGPNIRSMCIIIFITLSVTNNILQQKLCGSYLEDNISPASSYYTDSS